MKRSNAPIFWLLFGAGGMLSALFGSVLVFLTGLAGPLGWAPAARMLQFENAHAFAAHPLGKLLLLAVVALFAWHAAHRLLCTVHDFGIHKGLVAKTLSYGSAGVVSLVAAWALLRI